MRRIQIVSVRFTSVVRVLLGLILLTAGILKFSSLREFYEAVAVFPFIPEALVPFVAQAVIVVEVLCGLCLFLGFCLRLVDIFALTLTATFLFVTSLNLVTEGQFSCNCFGNLNWLQDRPLLHAVLNLVLLLLALSLFLNQQASNTISARQQKWMAIGVTVLVASVVAVTAKYEAHRHTDEVQLVLAAGNPFSEKQNAQALQSYLVRASVLKDGGTVPLSTLWEAGETNVLLFFKPLDCHVCLRYMHEMYEIVREESWDVHVHALMLAYNSDHQELQSLAKNWEVDEPIGLLEGLPASSWGTPFMVILNSDGTLAFANQIINSRERQAMLVRAVKDHLASLTDGRTTSFYPRQPLTNKGG